MYLPSGPEPLLIDFDYLEQNYPFLFQEPFGLFAGYAADKKSELVAQWPHDEQRNRPLLEIVFKEKNTCFCERNDSYGQLDLGVVLTGSAVALNSEQVVTYRFEPGDLMGELEFGLRGFKLEHRDVPNDGFVFGKAHYTVRFEEDSSFLHLINRKAIAQLELPWLWRQLFRHAMRRSVLHQYFGTTHSESLQGVQQPRVTQPTPSTIEAMNENLTQFYVGKQKMLRPEGDNSSNILKPWAAQTNWQAELHITSEQLKELLRRFPFDEKWATTGGFSEAALIGSQKKSTFADGTRVNIFRAATREEFKVGNENFLLVSIGAATSHKSQRKNFLFLRLEWLKSIAPDFVP